MRDFLALAFLLVALAVLLALSSPMEFVDWLRREWRLMRLTSWEFVGLDTRMLTRDDPRCRRMVIRQRSKGVHMRRAGVFPRVGISSAWQNDTRPDNFRFARRGA